MNRFRLELYNLSNVNLISQFSSLLGSRILWLDKWVGSLRYELLDVTWDCMYNIRNINLENKRVRNFFFLTIEEKYCTNSLGHDEFIIDFFPFVSVNPNDSSVKPSPNYHQPYNWQIKIQKVSDKDLEPRGREQWEYGLLYICISFFFSLFPLQRLINRKK